MGANTFKGRKWSKQSVVEALRARHEKGQSLAYIDGPSGLIQAAKARFGSYPLALEAAGIDYSKIRRYRSWDKAAVIEEIQKLRKTGVKMSSSAVQRAMPSLSRAIRAHFGSFGEAIKAAGIEYRPPQSWGKMVVFDRLRELHERGEDLSVRRLRNKWPKLYQGARYAFGSYQRAIELLGLDYAQVSRRRSWDKAAVLAEFRRLAAEGIEPRVSAIMKQAPRLVQASVKQFGSFVKAIRAADIGYQPRRVWTRKGVVKELGELHIAREDMWVAAMKRRHGGLYMAAVRLFGSYQKAIKSAGIELSEVEQAQREHNGRWYRESVVAALRERRKKGEALAYSKVPADLCDAARRYFGNYARAVEAAGVAYDSVCRQAIWNKDSIIRKLVELHQQGEDLSAGSMHKEHGGLMAACWRDFGSYRKAIEQAGMDYADISRFMRWDKDTVLRKMRALAGEGVDMSFKALRLSHPRLLDAAKRVFGRYPDARVAAGVGPPPLTRWNKEKIVEELQRAHREGAELAASRLSRSHPALYDAAYEYFGSYDSALGAAGFDSGKIRLSRDWTKQSIAQELRRLDEEGADLRSSGMRQVDSALVQTARRHFGSYKLALVEAGVDYPKKPLAGWARSGVLQMLRQLHEDGEDLRYSSMKKKRSSLFFAARYYFDSYVGAVKRAKLDYEAIVKEQLHGRRKWRRQAEESR